MRVAPGLAAVLALLASPAAIAPLGVDGATAGAAEARPAPSLKVAGEFAVGGRVTVQRPARGRVRWQVRTPRGWQPLSARARRTITLPPMAAGRPVRALLLRGGRWRPSVRRLVHADVSIVGDAAVGRSLTLNAPATATRLRWQARPDRGARWRAIARPGRTIGLRPGLAGLEVRGQARIQGRWWPSAARRVGGDDPAAATPAAEASLVVSGIGSVGTSLTAAWAGSSPEAAGDAIRWERRRARGPWRSIEGAEGHTLDLGPADRGQVVRACLAIPTGHLPDERCSRPVGPIASRPALGTQDDRLPVVRPKRIGRRLDLIARTGTGLTRVDLFWSDIAREEPADPADAADPAYDWRRADAILTGLAARGITPIVSVYSAPDWATGGLAPHDGRPVNPHAPDPEAFGEFMAALAQRYSGAYVRPGRSRPLPELRLLEIWNEPNIPMFLRPQRANGRLVSLSTYVDMVRAGYDSAKAVHPGLTVLVGALGSGRSARAFRDGLRRADVPLDAFSHHLYPRAGPLRRTPAYPSWSSLPELVRVLDAWRPGLPLFITEAGYSTEESSFRPRGSAVTERLQARFLADIFRVPLVRRGRVHGIVWFNLQANDAWTTGLLRTDGSRKPSYRRFVDLLRMAGRPPG